MYFRRRNTKDLSLRQRFYKLMRWTAILWDRYEALAIVVLGVLSFVFGFIGVANILGDTYQSLGAFDWFTAVLYETVQLLLMEMALHKGSEFNFWIGLGRAAAVFFVTVIAVKAIRALFRESLASFFMMFRGRHIFIAGLGRIGMHIALEKSKSQFVIARELEDIDYWTGLASEHGVTVQHGDAADEIALSHIEEKNPSEVYFVTGNDQTNVNAHAQFERLRTERRNLGRRVRYCRSYLHIKDSLLFSTLCRSQSERTRIGKAERDLEVNFFNLHHEAATDLVLAKLAKQRPMRPNQVALYIVIGCGDMGQAMLKELAELAHFENLKRSRILVLTTQPQKDADRVLSIWPQMSKRCVLNEIDPGMFRNRDDHWGGPDGGEPIEFAANVKFCRITNDEFLTHEEIKRLVQMSQRPRVKPIAIFCNDDDAKNFKMASDFNFILADQHNLNRIEPSTSWKAAKTASGLAVKKRKHNIDTIPCYVYLPKSRALREVILSSQKRRIMSPFGSVEASVRQAQDPLVKELAMVVAWAYRQHRLGLGTQIDQLNLDRFRADTWEKLEYWEQYSNLVAAKHAWIKLAILRLTVREVLSGDLEVPDLVNQLDERDRWLLATTEHHRWLAERLLLGWKCGATQDVPPQRPSMVAYQRLESQEFEKDLAQIHALSEYISIKVDQAESGTIIHAGYSN